MMIDLDKRYVIILKSEEGRSSIGGFYGTCTIPYIDIRHNDNQWIIDTDGYDAGEEF